MDQLTTQYQWLSSLQTRIQHIAAIRLIVAFILGGLLPLSFAPFDFWPVAILSIIGWQLISAQNTAKQSFYTGWSYGFGVFAIGASWVYVSIHDYGYAPVPLALFLTVLFTLLLGLFFAVQGYVYQRFFHQRAYASLIAFPLIWVLFEWIRSWFLTGFPWLYLGYGHLDTWLSGWAPVFGVYGVSLIVAITASAINNHLVHGSCGPKRFAIAGCVSLWIGGALLAPIEWSKPQEKFTVALLQGNIPQEKKWQPEYRPVSLKTYEELSRNLNVDLIIWPETAVPYFPHQVSDWLTRLENSLQPQQGLITGIPAINPSSTKENRIFHNSVTTLGKAEGLYYKQKLVPFGEYVPLQSYLRGLIEFFDLPMSNFKRGASEQAALSYSNTNLFPAICYEIAYPGFVASNVNRLDAGMILTLSNDAWFGDSIGPKQHLQIAQMRALENQRYVLRATNTGLTAVISPKGQIKHDMPSFTAGGIKSTVTSYSGSTPYSTWQNWPLLALIVITLTAIRYRKAE